VNHEQDSVRGCSDCAEAFFVRKRIETGNEKRVETTRWSNQTECLEVYNETNFKGILNCRNPLCFGGGLNLYSLILWAVVGAKRTEYETTERCEGYEGSPKGRRKDGPCFTYFKVKVAVVYKDDEV
jgi:hypothetical protein